MLYWEVLLFEPYHFKQPSCKQGNAWKANVEIQMLQLHWVSKSVKQAYWGSGKIQAKNKDELNASGASPLYT